MYDLKGKVALVTGAASGIGLACVKELLQNELKGVAMVDLNAANGQSALGTITKQFGKNRAIFIETDVCDKAQLEEAFETTVKAFGQLDIVMNNAGIMHEVEWERCLAINFTAVISGTLLATEKYLPKYKSTTDAIVLNTASILGLQAIEEMPTYCATKYGVIGFSKAMGGDYRHATTKIRVVAICPGLTDTPMPQDVSEKQIPEPYKTNLAERMKSYANQTAEDFAENAMHVLKEALSGTVWLLSGKKCNQINFAEYQ